MSDIKRLTRLLEKVDDSNIDIEEGEDDRDNKTLTLTFAEEGLSVIFVFDDDEELTEIRCAD